MYDTCNVISPVKYVFYFHISTYRSMCSAQYGWSLFIIVIIIVNIIIIIISSSSSSSSSSSGGGSSSVAGTCEYDNELSGSVKCGEFLD